MCSVLCTLTFAAPRETVQSHFNLSALSVPSPLIWCDAVFMQGSNSFLRARNLLEQIMWVHWMESYCTAWLSGLCVLKLSACSADTTWRTRRSRSQPQSYQHLLPSLPRETESQFIAWRVWISCGNGIRLYFNKKRGWRMQGEKLTGNVVEKTSRSVGQAVMWGHLLARTIPAGSQTQWV